MTEQAPPDYYFQNIIFNPKYYDNEVNNNITKYEADNKYIKYNSSNLQLTKTEAGLTTTINDLRLTSIGRLNNLFNLPTNTSTATPYSRLVLIDNTTRSTTWFPSSGNVGYNSTTSILTTENASGAIPDITNLVMSGSIGSSTAEKFILPSNSSSASVGSVLTLSNISTKATTWVSLPTAITDYTNYNNTAQTLISNVSGTPTTINALVLPSIGASILQKFGLPTNTSSASSGAILTLGASNLTSWTNPAVAITNYVNYDSGTSNLISNVSGTPTTITTINTSGLITAGSIRSNTSMNSATINTTGLITGATITSTGLLTAGSISSTGLISTTGTMNSAIINTTGLITGNTITSTNLLTAGSISSTGLISTTGTMNSAIINTTGLITGNTITSTNLLTAGSISSTGLISTTGTMNSAIINTTGLITGNTITSTNLLTAGSISSTGLISTTGNLQSRGLVIKNTSNVDVATISNTGIMTGTTLTLNGVSGLSCYNLDIRNSSDNSFRGSINGLFGLFSFRGAIECTEYTIKDFTSSTINATINSLGEINCKALTCTSIGGSSPQNFVLPSNTSTSTAGQVLSILDATAKTTQWLTIPTQISSYVDYNIFTGVLIYKSLSPDTNITSITIDNIGKSGQTFTLPNNTSTSTVGQVLSILNATSKTTQWITIPTQISNYINYSNPNLISNVSGTPTTITDLTITNIKSNSYDSSVADTGIITIGGGTSRTGDINIGTGKNTSSAQLIRIGSNDSNATGQEIRFSRPIQPPAIIQLSDRDMGYTLSNLTATTTAYASGSTVSLSIPSTNLYSNGNYMFRSSLKMNSNNTAKTLTSIKFGLNRSNTPIGYIQNCYTDMSINTGTAVIFVNKIYQLSSFFRTVGGASYTFDYVITFTGTGTLNVVSSIDIIRLS